MDKYKDIRPYNDDEVRAVLDSILSNPECVSAVSRLRFPRGVKIFPGLFNVLVRWGLSCQVKDIYTVDDFQKVVEHYMTHMIKSTMSQLTVSGTENLEPGQAYLFMSNHRDIALDPAFVNYALLQHGCGTMRIAIGDNLLTKDYVTDLMRLNKSFIVKRSAKGPRQLFAALKLLSSYIRHSITEDKVHIWIAEREGRAKDGDDRADPTIIKMFSMSAQKGVPFAEGVKALKIVPVSISYEYDPCDAAKAKELYELDVHGSYQKQDQEDVESIALGIAGYKGHVHIEFGQELSEALETPESVSDALDQHIIKNYVLHPSNYFAYEALHGELPNGVYSDKHIVFDASKLTRERDEFNQRLQAVPEAHRPYLLKAYAQPIVNKKAMGAME